MYNQPYFIPGYYASGVPSMMRGGMMRGAMNGARMAAQTVSPGMGLFGRLGSGIQAIKKINWGGLITNTSKTLNVVNQAIPLVRQVGPMVNNVKSMLRVASIFKDETDSKPTRNTRSSGVNSNIGMVSRNSSSGNTRNSEYVSENTTDNNRDYSYDGSPTFFVSS